MTQRATDPPFINLSTPMEIQLMNSTNSRLRRASHRSLPSAKTPKDSVATFHGNSSRPERPDSSPLPATPQPLFGSTANRAPMGFLPLRRLSTKAATNTRIASPSCATPTGFLNLLTFYSARASLTLFRARSVHGVRALRGFPLPVAGTAFTALCPSSHMPHESAARASKPLRKAIHHLLP
jgi:hypothetical protein